MDEVAYENIFLMYMDSIFNYCLEKINAYSSFSNKEISSDLLEEKNKIALENALISYGDVYYYMIENNLSAPILDLIEMYKLTKFEFHILMLSLSLECNYKFREKYFEIFKSYTLTIDISLQIFLVEYDEIVDASFWKKISRMCQLFFEDGSKTLDTVVKLDKTSLEILLNKDVKLPFFCYENVKPKIVYDDFFEYNIDYLKEIINKTAIVLTGDFAVGKKRAVETLALKIETDVIFVDCKIYVFLPENAFKDSCEKLFRMASFKNVALCFYDFPSDTNKTPKSLQRFLSFLNVLIKFDKKIFFTTENTNNSDVWSNINYLSFSILPPNELEQKQIWESYLVEELLNIKSDYTSISDFLVSRFSLTKKQIENAVSEFTLKCKKDMTLNNLVECCYNQTTSLLHENATKIDVCYNFDDVILPEDLKNEIKNSCNHIKYKSEVYIKWGFLEKFSYGTGTTILFNGSPGTGKTMIAQAIANDLNMELYRIDLSAVVSKYVGETEKNLDKIFNDAKNSGVILFFDEMDSLFGKRSETKDAHDKYANMETAYLLQQIELFDGVILMATNYLNNIDDAFMRRLQFVFTLPLPTKDERFEIWKKCYPKEVELDEDIDFLFLAENFLISPAIIKNITLSSAFFCAAKNDKITMEHILKALYFELKKDNALLLESNFKPYEYLVKEFFSNDTK